MVSMAVGLLGHLGAPMAQELGRLYAARPPAGSAYLRFVTDAARPITVAIEGIGGDQTLPSDGQRATRYLIVRGGQAARIVVDGRPAATITPEPERFTTVFLPSDPAVPVTPIADTTEGGNDLKADLRVYNFVPGCQATISVAGGSVVFEGVGERETRRRVINPIGAELVGQCGQIESAPYRLPVLKAADHYSLFLVGSAGSPVLVGQQDATEAYERSE